MRREAYSTIRKNFNNPCGFFNDPQEFQECPTRETISSILSNLKMEHIQQFRGIYTNHYTYSMIRKSSNNVQSAKEFEEFPTHQENGEAYSTRENFNKTFRTANDPQELQECPNVREVQSCSTIRKNGAAFATIRKR